MSAKVLNIIETAYRATLEEQDDTILWLTQALKGAGADISVLLRGNAVNYAVKGQDASGLRFGDKAQTQPPRIDEDIERMISKGIRMLVVEDDLAERGVEKSDLVANVESISRSGIPALMDSYDKVWHW